MIGEENFVSLSEISSDAKSVFTSLPKARKRFVIENDKPVGVVMSIEEYNMQQIPSVEPDAWEKSAISQYEKSRISGENDESVDAFDFLEKLKNGSI